MRGISKTTQEELARIYHWIEENKHKYKHGVNNSRYFAHVVRMTEDPDRFYTNDLKVGTVEYNHYVQKISNYRANGYMRYEAPLPGEKKQWSVVESKLPAGTINYTGVRTTIPLEPPTPKPPVVLPPAQPVDKEKLRREGVEYIEEELKELWVNGAQLEHKYGVASFKRVSLYTLYKAALALQCDKAAIEKEHKPDETVDEVEGEGKPF